MSDEKRDAQVAWRKGREFGEWEGKQATSHHIPMGMAIGVVIGAVLQPIVFWVKGVCW